jgi:hypothetical protein
MYYPYEKRTILTAEPLANGIVRVFTNIFPLDRTGWYRLRLILSGVIGAGVTPYADGLYRWVKGITIRTSRGEVLINQVPGMALYWKNALLNHSAPVHDILLAAGGTVQAILDIDFTFPFLNRAEDTIFDSGRYSNIELQIATGTVADFAPAGAATAAVTMGIEIHSTLSAMIQDGTGKPFALPYVATYPLIHADIQRFWDLESSLDLGLFGFFIYNHDASARPFCGAAVGNDHLTDVSFKDTVRIWMNNVDYRSFQEERRKLLPYNFYTAIIGTELPTLTAGLYPHLFVRSGSINEVYATGKKSFIRLEFANATGTDEADLCVFGMRALR